MTKIIRNGTLSLLLLFAFSSRTKCEVFTAIVDMEPLLETEKHIVDTLKSYIQYKEDKLVYLKKKMEDYKTQYEKATKDIDGFLGNPINAYKLIKKLTVDYEILKEVILGEHDEDNYFYNVSQSMGQLKVPTFEDFSGASKALMRLQSTYKLHIPDLVKGVVLGTQASEPMTASECFEIGRLLYNNEDFHHTDLWMTEALKAHNEESEKTAVKVDILEYLAFTKYKLGDVDKAIVYTNELLDIEPEHKRAKNNIPHYIEKLKEIEEQHIELKTADVPENKKPEFGSYEGLCRGEYKINPYLINRLRCRYYIGNHPFLKIAPFQLEEVYYDPYIVLFHNVMSDSEIYKLQNLAKPRFKRATVQNSKSGELEVAEYRISKSAWLKDYEDSVVAAISARITDLTDLSLESAEELQVVNYGIGGHYEPHFDFARRGEIRESFSEAKDGNRIATVLFYMTDVEQGGATVFIELGIGVKPVKGSALFWYNLHPSGEGNFATRHAACPVLQGSKWVCNKWIHQRGQELRKKCTLEYQPEGF